jgi:signal transduction histidine kinase/ligand-binding sensor domain-containing protein
MRRSTTSDFKVAARAGQLGPVMFVCGVALSLWLFGAWTVSAAEPAMPLVSGQSFYVRSWVVSDGTSANSVMGVIRRPDGYLWVVSRFGLFRFDGEEFKPFQKIFEKVAPGVLQYTLLQDSRGRLWLTTRQGSNSVVCAEGHTARAFSDKEGLPPDLCPESIAEDAKGSIWLSYDQGPFYRIEEGSTQAVPVTLGLEGNDSTTLVSDAQRRIWYARGRQVGTLRDERLIPLLTHEEPVTRLAVARDGGLLFSDDKTIWKYRGGRELECLGTVPSGEMKLLIEDQRGRVWVAVNTATAGLLFCHEGGGFKSVPVVCPYIVSLSDDMAGNIWVGTRRSGLIQVRPRSVELTTPVDKAPNDIQSFCETTDGIRFATGVDGTLVRAKENGWEPLDSEQGWTGGFAEAVAADPRGGAWVGTRDKGLFHWQAGAFTSVCSSNLASISNIFMLLACSNGDLWIGPRTNGLFRVREGKTEAFALPSGQLVTSLAEDPTGTVWVGTENGLSSCISVDKMEVHTIKTGEIQQPINCLHATPDGSLWIGYVGSGLGRLKQGTFFLFGKEQGLAEKGITEIVSDGQGFIWCASSRGLFRLKLKELESMAAGESSKLHPYFCGYGEGLPVLQGSNERWPRAARSQSGELFMATGSGLAIVHPGRIRENQLPPPAVVIERVSLNGREVALYDAYLAQSGTHAGPVVDLNGLTGVFSLGQGVRQLGIEFAAVSFTGYENMKFQYRLEGLDDEWVEAGAQKSAYYSQLPPGNYRFRVKACNNEGTWNEAGAALDLTVSPFFWQTAWFRVGGPLMVVSLLLGWIVLGLRQHLQRQLERLELQHATEQERARIARDMHDELGSYLTRIVMISESEPGSPAHAAETGGAMAEINQTGREMTVKMSEIVWSLNPAHDSLESFAGYVAKRAHELLAAAKIHCRLDLPLDLPASPLSSPVRHEVLLAFKEALHNIVKHAQASSVLITLRLDNASFVLAVKDDGKGFVVPPASSLQGHGLANMKHRLAEAGGHCEVLSQPGEGTCIRFTVPLG